MTDALAAALATPGLPWLWLTIGIAGLIRGFTGFGTALIYVPVAGQFLPPAEVVLTLTVTGIGSIVVLLPRAWALAERRDVSILAAGAIVLTPAGVFLLAIVPAETVRWIVAAVCTLTLAALVSGIRYRGRVRPIGMAAVGSVTGVVGGATGLTGPPVILFYLGAEGREAPVIRANTILFLAIVDVAVTANLFAASLVDLRTVALGLVLTPVYMATTWVGARAFRPGLERPYRLAAYAVIAAAILTGLPLGD